MEKKAEAAADGVLNPNIFPRSSNPKDINERWFWGPKQYSPSKLAMAVSDLIVVVWIMLGLAAVLPRLVWLDSPFGGVLVFVANGVVIVLTAIYAFLILCWCRSGEALKWNQVKGGINYRLRESKKWVGR